jgi:hypothetical protein
MTKAKCSRPIMFVADSMKRSGLFPETSCTIQHVTSRNKSIKGNGQRLRLQQLWLQQLCSVWQRFYWDTHHPEYVSKTEVDPEWPKRFVFMKCDC